MKKMIITADDFGAESYIDAAIYDCIEFGTVNCVSSFVNFGTRSETTNQNEYIGSVQAIIDLHERFNNQENFGVGLHINITAGKSIGNYQTLTDEGGYFKRVRNIGDEIDIDEVKNEIRLQVEAFNSTGVKMDHISCHHGSIDLIPEFRKILIELAPLNVPFRRPELISQKPPFNKRPGFRKSRMFTKGILKGLSIALAGDKKFAIGTVFDKLKNNYLIELLEAGRWMPDYFIDTFYGFGTQNRLKTIIKNGPKDSSKIAELVVHVGLNFEEDYKKKVNGISRRYAKKRRPLEYETLMTPSSKKLFNSIRLLSFQNASDEEDRSWD